MTLGDGPTARVRDRAGVRVVALGAMLSMLLVLALAQSAVARRARIRSIPLSVSVDAAHPGSPVPANFLGLSFELSSLPQLARYANRGDFVTMLRSLGGGVLRFGGVTADEQVAWTNRPTARPAWALGTLEAGSLRQLGALAASSGWPVLLTIGLGHFEPFAAASEAAVAKAALGPSLEAIELGNEPDSYARHGLRPEPWTVIQYDEQVAAYRSAIEATAPGIALAGPDVSGSSAFEKWGPAEAVDQKPVLLTGHHYPLGCNQVPAPSIERLLSPQIRQREIVSLRRYMTVAELSATPFRLDETNTVSCGGEPGISDTFASALWAVSYVTQAMSMGLAGINLQGNPTNCGGYTPVCAPTAEALANGALQAQPEWYGLLLAKALIGDRPIQTNTSSPDKPNVYVNTFVAADGTLHVVVVDDDAPKARRVRVRLHLGRGFHGASILSLTAPSLSALSGVRLGGRAVAPGGSWTEPSSLPRAPNRNGVITVQMSPGSAALLTVSPKVAPGVAAAAQTPARRRVR